MEKVAPYSEKRFRPLVVGLVSLGILFLLLTYLGPAIWIILLVYHLFAGWALHAWTVIPSLKYDIGTICLSLVAGCLAIALLQRFLRYAIHPSWPLKRTVLSTGIFLSMTAAAIAMTGIVHELAWLFRSPIIVSTGRGSNRIEAINNGKQVHLAIVELAEDGIFPRSIEDISSHLGHRGNLFSYQPSRSSKLREPFLLLRPGEDILALAPETPVIAALGLDGDRCVIILADGSVEFPYFGEIEDFLHQRP